MPARSGKLAAIAVLLFGLAACAPPPRTTVNVVGDKFSKEITIDGLPLSDRLHSNSTFWMLRSFVEPQSRVAVHEIYVEWFFPGHGTTRYHAADDTARPLQARQILKESCGRNCGQTDTISIDIDEATLRARAAEGFQVKLSGNDGSAWILDITSQMINAQLQAEEQILKGPAVASATPNDKSPAAPSGPTLGINYMSASQVNPVLYRDGGMFVVNVVPNSPAEKAGMKNGDVLVSFDGTRLSDPAAARDIIGRAKAGSVVKLEIQRGSDRMKLDAHM